ncbi:MAG: sec-independent translocase [Actinomycetes bacterium]
MFGDIGLGEILALGVVAMFVFGPDKLPKIAADAGRMVRQLRRMATDARSDLSEHLGSDFSDLDLRDLNPRRAVSRAIFEDERDDRDQRPARRPAPVEPGERPPYDADAT